MDKLQDELTAADLAKWRELHTDSGFWYSKPILRLVDEVERQCEQLERARELYLSVLCRACKNTPMGDAEYADGKRTYDEELRKERV